MNRYRIFNRIFYGTRNDVGGTFAVMTVGGIAIASEISVNNLN